MFSYFLATLVTSAMIVLEGPCGGVSSVLNGCPGEELITDAAEVADLSETSTMYVTATKLNVRSTPSTFSSESVVGMLKWGESIEVAEFIEGWSAISYEDSVAFISTNFLSEEEPKPPVIETKKSYSASIASAEWDGKVLTKRAGRIQGPSGSETWYNLNMNGCVKRMHRLGFEGEYWVREDGCKMFGDYIMVAADFEIRPLGTILETSLGTAIVVDTGTYVETNPTGIDVAVDW